MGVFAALTCSGFCSRIIGSKVPLSDKSSSLADISQFFVET